MHVPRLNHLSLMRNNSIGHTIFLTCEKYRMTNPKPDTIFSHVHIFSHCVKKWRVLSESALSLAQP